MITAAQLIQIFKSGETLYRDPKNDKYIPSPIRKDQTSDETKDLVPLKLMEIIHLTKEKARELVTDPEVNVVITGLKQKGEKKRINEEKWNVVARKIREFIDAIFNFFNRNGYATSDILATQEATRLEETVTMSDLRRQIETLKNENKQLKEENFSLKEPGIKKAFDDFKNNLPNYDLGPLIPHINCDPIVNKEQQISPFHWESLIKQITTKTIDLLSDEKVMLFLYEVLSKVNKKVSSQLIYWLLALPKQTLTLQQLGKVFMALQKRNPAETDSEDAIKLLNTYMLEKDKFKDSNIKPTRSLINIIKCLDGQMDHDRLAIFKQWIIKDVDPFKGQNLNPEKLFKDYVEPLSTGILFKTVDLFSEDVNLTNFK